MVYATRKMTGPGLIRAEAVLTTRRVPALARLRMSVVFLLSALVLLLAGHQAGRAADQQFVTIGTGGVTGVYYPSGGATCKIVNRSRAEHGVRCSVETTFGSISNIEKIRSGEIDFGYVQTDWQYHAYNGTSAFEKAGPFEDLRSVFSLHTEVATVVVRKESGFRTFADLKNARINVGSDGSGSAASWRALISLLGWTEADQTKLSELKTSELAEALCSEDIDAYFVLIGHPAGLIEETQERCDIRLLGIEGEALDRLLEETSYYMPASVPAALYDLDGPVPSFGVVATFVTSARMPDDIVRTMVQALLDHFDSFKRLHPALQSLTMQDMTGQDATGHDMAAPLHPGALALYREMGLLPEADPGTGD